MTIDEAVKMSGFLNPVDIGSRKYAQQAMTMDETLLFAYQANYALAPSNTPLVPGKVLSLKKKQSGVLAVTNRRVFICSRVLGESVFKEIPLNSIQSIDEAGSMLMGLSQLRIKGLTEYFIIDLNKWQSKHTPEFKNAIYSPSSLMSQGVPNQMPMQYGNPMPMQAPYSAPSSAPTPAPYVMPAQAPAQNVAPTAMSPQSSAADQLLKFKELLDAGLMTYEEFEAQKAKLLG